MIRKIVIFIHTLYRWLVVIALYYCSTIERRPISFTRQLDGALNRVPNDFYDRVWRILDRTPPGLKVAGYYLPQVMIGDIALIVMFRMNTLDVRKQYSLVVWKVAWCDENLYQVHMINEVDGRSDAEIADVDWGSSGWRHFLCGEFYVISTELCFPTLLHYLLFCTYRTRNRSNISRINYFRVTIQRPSKNLGFTSRLGLAGNPSQSTYPFQYRNCLLCCLKMQHMLHLHRLLLWLLMTSSSFFL